MQKSLFFFLIISYPLQEKRQRNIEGKFLRHHNKKKQAEK